MTFSTLMVHLELEHPNDARLQIAGDLAERFNAEVIGIAASNPQPPYYAGGSVARSFVERERIEVKKRIEEAEARFVENWEKCRTASIQSGRPSI